MTRWLDDTEMLAWQGLLVVANRVLPEVERSLKAHDLLAIHYHVFVALSAAPDRTLRLSELADMSNISQSRLTHRMRDLTANGDVEVTVDPQDHRARNATLTAQGMARLERVAPIHVEDVRRLVFDALSAEQTAALADAMSSIAATACGHEQFLCTPERDAAPAGRS